LNLFDFLAYVPDFEEPEKKIHSSKLNSVCIVFNIEFFLNLLFSVKINHLNYLHQIHLKIDVKKTKIKIFLNLKYFFLANIQQRLLPVPRKHDSDDEIASDDSNPDFERFLAEANRRKNTDD